MKVGKIPAGMDPIDAKQCGKILVSESKLGLCPKCADKDKRVAAEAIGGLALAGRIIKIAWKPVKVLLKTIIKK